MTNLGDKMISRGQSALFASKKNPYKSKLKYTISYKAEGSEQAGTANDLIHIALSTN